MISKRKPTTTQVSAPGDKQSLRAPCVPLIPRSPLRLLFAPDSLKVGTSQEIAPMIKALTRRLGDPSGTPSGSWSHGLGSLPLGKVSSSKGLTRVCIKTHRRKRIARADPHLLQDCHGVSERRRKGCQLRRWLRHTCGMACAFECTPGRAVRQVHHLTNRTLTGVGCGAGAKLGLH